MEKRVVVLLSLLAAAVPFTLVSEIRLTVPVKDSTVALLPQNQKDIMQIATHEERLAALNADRKTKKTFFSPGAVWRGALPVRFEWICTEQEKGPYKVLISTTEDFADPQVLFSSWDNKTKAHRLQASASGYLGNFKLGQKYFWKVVGYKDFKKRIKAESAVSSFTTEDHPPRWIAVEGRVRNIRDLGGYRTADGKRVRQGMIFRGQGLNDNSIDREIPGRNRLTLADQHDLLEVLKIRTDLELRSSGETANMKTSPLGEKVRFIHHSSPAYKAIFGDSGKKIMAKNFRVFCDEKNYPVYFHCIAGADRTGSLAFVLNGILGVPERELGTDWEHTFYPDLPDNAAKGNPNSWRLYQHFPDGFAKYGKAGDSMQKRVELYLLDCGIKPEEIETFRSIMLE